MGWEDSLWKWLRGIYLYNPLQECERTLGLESVFRQIRGDGGAARRRGLGWCLLLRGSGLSGGGILACMTVERGPRPLEGGRPPQSTLDSQLTIGIGAGLEGA